MNTNLRDSLRTQNLTQVADATRIAPHTLQRIVDGNHLPTPEEIDALAGFFRGEYAMSGTDFAWRRIRRPDPSHEPLPLASYAKLPQREWSPWAPPPALKPGPKVDMSRFPQGVTGTGQKV